MVTQVGPGMGPAVGITAVFILVWLMAAGAGLVGGIIFLVAAWRTMRAHESLAESARIATELMAKKGG